MGTKKISPMISVAIISIIRFCDWCWMVFRARPVGTSKGLFPVSVPASRGGVPCRCQGEVTNTVTCLT